MLRFLRVRFMSGAQNHAQNYDTFAFLMLINIRNRIRTPMNQEKN